MTKQTNTSAAREAGQKYIAIGYGKYTVCRDHFADSQLYRQECLGRFDTREEAQLFIEQEVA